MFNKTPHPQTCERCPHRYSKTGCPAWIRPENGFMETNVQNGDQRVVQGCFYEVMPKLMVHVVQAANRPAAVLQEWRNELGQAFNRIATALNLRAEPPQLEDKSDGKGE